MSLFTSRFAANHGVVDETTALPESATTLAEILSGQGYKTTAFVSWVYLSPKFGFEQGFDEYYLQIDPSRLSLADGGGAYDAREIVDAAEHWLSQPVAEPYFLFVHLFDPHLDYRAPPPYDQLFTQDYAGEMDGSYEQVKPFIRGMNPEPRSVDPADQRHLDALYQSEIRFVDDQVGRLLKAVDARSTDLDNLVVVVADHGEEIGDHGSLEGHGWTLYEEIIRVPMILRFPGLAHAGRVVPQPVGLIDIAPTVLDLLQLESPEPFQGRSLLPLISPTREPSAVTPVFTESGGRFGIVKRAVRGSRFKLIQTLDTGTNRFGVPIQAGYELYDLESDPHEHTNIYRPGHPAARRLESALEGALRLSASVDEDPAAAALELSEEEKRMLESLGYIQ